MTAQRSTPTTVAFTTAADYYSGEETEQKASDTAFAKGIVWFDQATPIFVCNDCAQECQHLKHQGSATVENYGERRADAYDELLTTDPECQVCAGDLPSEVQR